MKWALLLVLGSTGTIIVASCLLVLFIRGRFRRRLRIDPKVATPAPILWLADPRSPARLHRRLARAGRSAKSVSVQHTPQSRLLRRDEPTPPLAELAEDLVQQAIKVDHGLSLLANLPPASRRKHLAEIEKRITEIEGAAAELVSLSSRSEAPTSLAVDDGDLLDVTNQISRMVAAQKVLDEIDARSGLATNDPG